MGCWNQTCSLTNLPIKYNDKIVIIPLMLSNMEIDGLAYDINDKYSPFCIPIVGEYNEYGGIENVENEALVMSFLKDLCFHYIDNDETIDVTFESVEDFFDIVLEKTLYITINEENHKINYMMIHYDLYCDLIRELSIRNINCNKQKKYRLVLQDKINSFITRVEQKKDANKTKEELMNGLENICSNVFSNLNDDMKKKLIRDISSPSCHLHIVNDSFHGFVYDNLLKSLIFRYDETILNIMLDMLMFEKALQLLRNGYLVHTGLGHQGCELKLHLIVTSFINSYIQKIMDTAKEHYYSNEELDDFLKEEIFFNET